MIGPGNVAESDIGSFGIEIQSAFRFLPEQKMRLSKLKIADRFYVTVHIKSPIRMNLSAEKVEYFGNKGFDASFCNFTHVNGEFTNCSLNHLQFLHNCSFKFSSCTFLTGRNLDQLLTAIPIKIGGFADLCTTEFHRCIFNVPDSFDAGSVLAFSVRPNFSPVFSTRFDECTSESGINHFVDATRGDKVEINGGRLKVRRAVVRLTEQRSAPAVNLRIDSPSRWEGALLELVEAPTNSASPKRPWASIQLSGKFSFPTARPMVDSNNSGNRVAFSGTLKGGIDAHFILPFNPNDEVRGFPGVTLSDKSFRPIKLWHYSDSTAFGKAEWT